MLTTGNCLDEMSAQAFLGLCRLADPECFVASVMPLRPTTSDYLDEFRRVGGDAAVEVIRNWTHTVTADYVYGRTKSVASAAAAIVRDVWVNVPVTGLRVLSTNAQGEEAGCFYLRGRGVGRPGVMLGPSTDTEAGTVTSGVYDRDSVAAGLNAIGFGELGPVDLTRVLSQVIAVIERLATVAGTDPPRIHFGADAVRLALYGSEVQLPYPAAELGIPYEMQ